MFWQNTLLISKEVYHEKEKNSNSIHRNESGVSIINCKTLFSKTSQLLTSGSNILLGTSECPQIGN